VRGTYEGIMDRRGCHRIFLDLWCPECKCKRFFRTADFDIVEKGQNKKEKEV